MGGKTAKITLEILDNFSWKDYDGFITHTKNE
jgi:hypothetical protein